MTIDKLETVYFYKRYRKACDYSINLNTAFPLLAQMLIELADGHVFVVPFIMGAVVASLLIGNILIWRHYKVMRTFVAVVQMLNIVALVLLGVTSAIVVIANFLMTLIGW